MKKILKQIGVKCKLTKTEMKIYGEGMIDASKKKIFVGNSKPGLVANFFLSLGESNWWVFFVFDKSGKSSRIEFKKSSSKKFSKEIYGKGLFFLKISEYSFDISSRSLNFWDK